MDLSIHSYILDSRGGQDMKRLTKKSFLVCLIAVYVLGFSLFSWIKPADEFSVSERRYLKQFPDLSIQTILNGTFMSNFESYTLDQFPLRDTFRSVKSLVAGMVFQHKDVNDLYIYDDYIVSMEYPMHSDSITWAAKKFENVYNLYLKDSNSKVYFSIIPDKNYFLGEESGHLSFDYEAFEAEMTAQVPFMEYIPIMDQLTIEDYYMTDTHWNQTGILDVAQTLANGMGVSIEEEFEKLTVNAPFYGVYYGQFARPVKADVISYYTNDILNQSIVYDHQNGKEIPMYDLKKVNDKDPYEMFLGGPLSLVTIENPNANTEKELVIFRDSFGSSIAPLLTEAYAKITLVDIRYIQPAMLEKFMTFDSQDVLFLYSTSVLNNSSTIK